MFPLKQNGIAKKKVFFTVHLLISVTPGVIAVRWRDDNSHQNIFISFDIIMF